LSFLNAWADEFGRTAHFMQMAAARLLPFQGIWYVGNQIFGVFNILITNNLGIANSEI
jgi:hypothetical protein